MYLIFTHVLTYIVRKVKYFTQSALYGGGSLGYTDYESSLNTVKCLCILCLFFIVLNRFNLDRFRYFKLIVLQWVLI